MFYSKQMCLLLWQKEGCRTLVVLHEADCVEPETDDDVRIFPTEDGQKQVEELSALLISQAVEHFPVPLRPAGHVNLHHVHEDAVSERRIDVIMERPTADSAGRVLLLEPLHARRTRLVQLAVAAHAREVWEVFEADGTLFFSSVHVEHGQTQDGKLRC